MQTQDFPQNSIRVFGEHHIRVEPDMVSLQFQVSRNSPNAEEAINNAEKTSTEIQAYLKEANVARVAVSPVELSTTYTNVPNTLDYQANIMFHVVLDDLKRLSDIAVGITANGANSIVSTDFLSGQLESRKAESQNAAIRAAREKATSLCEGLEAKLGRVIRIDDRGSNPQQPPFSNRFNNNQQSRFGGYEQPGQGFDIRGAETGQVVNPVSILISTQIEVLFEIDAASD